MSPLGDENRLVFVVVLCVSSLSLLFHLNEYNLSIYISLCLVASGFSLKANPRIAD